MVPLLRRPWLWQFSRRRVALGAGIGVFFGLMVPVAQIPAAAAFAIVLRANLPAALLGTLVSNPLTYAPIGVLAYRTGAAILGHAVKPHLVEALGGDDEGTPADGSRPGWVERMKAVGKPLFVGLALFATVGGVLAWGLVHLGWTLSVWFERRRRRRRRNGGAARPDPR